MHVTIVDCGGRTRPSVGPIGDCSRRSAPPTSVFVPADEEEEKEADDKDYDDDDDCLEPGRKRIICDRLGEAEVGDRRCSRGSRCRRVRSL